MVALQIQLEQILHAIAADGTGAALRELRLRLGCVGRMVGFSSVLCPLVARLRPPVLHPVLCVRGSRWQTEDVRQRLRPCL